VEPHHFYAAPGKNFDAAPAPVAPAPVAPAPVAPTLAPTLPPALAPTLPYSKAKFENELKLKQMLKQFFVFDSVRFILIKYELKDFVFVFNY
jgi:hypothetical protein